MTTQTYNCNRWVVLDDCLWLSLPLFLVYSVALAFLLVMTPFSMFHHNDLRWFDCTMSE